jgi:hypothetical protein
MLTDPIGFRRVGGASIEGSPLVIGHPKLQALHAFWDQMRGERALPTRDAFPFEALRIWLGHIAIVEVLREPAQFRFRLFGTRLVELAGKDLTGQTFDKCVPPDRFAAAVDPYNECLARCGPVVRAVRYAAPGGAPFMLEQLLLPCASDQGAIDVIVAATYLERMGGAGAPA